MDFLTIYKAEIFAEIRENRLSRKGSSFRKECKGTRTREEQGLVSLASWQLEGWAVGPLDFHD